MNTSLLIAKTGARVILVDGDLRNPIISRELHPLAEKGFVDVISDNCSLEEVVWKNLATGRSHSYLQDILLLYNLKDYYNRKELKRYYSS